MNENQRTAIREALARRTQEANVDRKTARAFLIREGFYTKTGALAAAYGGKKPAER